MISKVCSKIDEFKYPQQVVGLFLLTWLIISVFQSVFTELAHDEAYYWLYSRNLSWGYFDHPPMIALLIKIGYSIFPNEFGVRLIPVFMGVGTLWLIYLLIREHTTNLSGYIIILSSIVIVHSHIGSFLAIPDNPAIFFSTLFIFLYKKYIKTYSTFYAIFLGLVAAAMLYSKYHGVLVLIFTLLSNLKLFKKPSFYLIPVIAALAMLPHLMWQINNGFPTFEYHLVSRSSEYTVLHTLDYILAQLLIAGPFIGFLVFYHSIIFKTEGNEFFRSLKFNFYGFFVFFLLMSFKGHTEAHWTAIGFVPALIFTIIGIEKNLKGVNWIRKIFLPTIILFFLVRLALIIEIIPPRFNIGREFHNWDDWAEEIKEVAGDRKVVFNSTFQRPAKYSFYTGGEFAHSLNQVWYRKNQFDLWNYHDRIQGEKVILFRVGRSSDSVFTSAHENYSYFLYENFTSYYDIPIYSKKESYIFPQKDSADFDIEIVNVRNKNIDLTNKNKYSPRIAAVIAKGDKFLNTQRLEFIDANIASGDTLEKTIRLHLPPDIGSYTINFAIINDKLRPGFNSKPVYLNIEK